MIVKIKWSQFTHKPYYIAFKLTFFFKFVTKRARTEKVVKRQHLVTLGTKSTVLVSTATKH